MNEKTISRAELLHKLVRVAQVRSVITMLSMLPIWFIGFAAFGDSLGHGGMAVLFFGGPLIVCWLITVCYCKPAVTCPHCGNSLWACGTGNFKPRRMKLRADIQGCPNCKAPIL